MPTSSSLTRQGDGRHRSWKGRRDAGSTYPLPKGGAEALTMKRELFPPPSLLTARGRKRRKGVQKGRRACLAEKTGGGKGEKKGRGRLTSFFCHLATTATAKGNRIVDVRRARKRKGGEKETPCVTPYWLSHRATSEREKKTEKQVGIELALEEEKKKGSDSMAKLALDAVSPQAVTIERRH